MKAARRLFAERGYEGTRTADIAREAGIATGTLFNYAPTKRHVVLLLWTTRVRGILAAGLAAADEAEEPTEIVRAIFDPIFKFYAEDPELGRVFVQTVAFDNEGVDLKEFNEGFIAALSARLAPHAPTTAPVAATNVFAAYYLVLSLVLNHTITDPDAATAALLHLVAAQRQGWV